MQKLLITADIHGNYNAWLTINALLDKDDALAVAGDLFDTRYGNWSSPAFAPDTIKSDLKSFSHPFFYVYGNCDVPSFFPGYESGMQFSFSKKQIHMVHNYFPSLVDDTVDIVIHGHTHLASLEQKENTILLNPGSITSPRNGLYTYAVMQGNTVSLVELNPCRILSQISL